jgi:hypothetical protein
LSCPSDGISVEVAIQIEVVSPESLFICVTRFILAVKTSHDASKLNQKVCPSVRLPVDKSALRRLKGG